MKHTIFGLILSTLLFLSVSFNIQANASFSFAAEASDSATKHVIFVSDPESLSGQALTIDEQSDGRLSALLQLNEFKANSDETLHLQMLGSYDEVLVLGFDSQSDMSASDIQNLGGRIAGVFGSTKNNLEANVFTDGLGTDTASTSAHLAYGYHLRHYSFDKYKTKKDDGQSAVTFVSNNADSNAALYTGDLQFIAQGVHLARDLASEPGKSIYPQAFVERVRALFKGVDNVDIEVLDLKDMEKYNMGALMGVGKGSIHEPKMLVIEYMGGKKGEAPIALAGKGITFDTGGISIKSNNNMWMMKADLSGAAAVAGTMHAVAQRGEAVNLVGLMPLAENMPAEDAIRPGDVLETMQGTTIEIISTDAEGRLILSDAVYYAQQKYSPKMLLNIATLTGSAARALSDEYAALITRNMPLSLEMMEVGKRAGEHVWPLPLHENHFKQIHSDIADIKNSGAGNPGASIGAAVIGTFVDEDLPWVHLDIAGVDWLSASTDTVPKGSQGWGVRFMDQLVRENK